MSDVALVHKQLVMKLLYSDLKCCMLDRMFGLPFPVDYRYKYNILFKDYQ